MEDLNAQQEDALKQAEELLMKMQKGNEEQVANLLQLVNNVRENVLFQEVGKMTRQLHDALESFRRDSRIDSLAEQDIPDARERLSYVIEMTQRSADRTLHAVEETLPMADNIAERAGKLGDTWKKFRRRELTADQFRDLSASIEQFLGDIETESSVMKNHLNEVLMAQDFQDLTGQIIKRVITLVEEVEGNLVELIRLTGQQLVTEKKEQQDAIAAEGPQVPGVGNNDVVQGQDEVDDLLSSLGF
jgi:chemotaxis protein CheZ